MASLSARGETAIVLLPPGDKHSRHNPRTRMRRKQLQKGISLMLRHWHKAAWALLATPLCAFGFEAVDVLTPASNGVYPAYPSDVGAAPYAIWAQGGLMYDSNILRTTTGHNNEWVSRLGLGGRWDQRVVGRQALHLEGRVDGYVYDKFSALDNVAYAGLGEWRYEVGNDLAGAFSIGRRRYQANLAEIQRAVYDPITETHFSANGRYALGPTIGIRGAADYLEYSRPTHAFANLKTLTGLAAVEYRSALGNTLGVELQQAHGDAPVDQVIDPLRLFVNNDFHQRDVGVVGGFNVLPTMRVGGRVGRTERTYSVLPGRNFNGPTWAVLAQWFPTAKTLLAFDTAKTISSVIDIGASHVVVKGWGFGPGWAPTAKLNFQARFFRQHQVFEGDPSAQLRITRQREEIVRGYRLGAYWDYDRRISYQFSVEHGERESNTLGRNYRFNAGIAQVRWAF